MVTLKISEIFYSIQGEGRRVGEPSIFIRLQGCSAKHACYESGVRCDTEFESGQEMSLDDLGDRIRQLAPNCKWIVWTGGEPLDQLTFEVLEYFKNICFKQAVETSGVKPIGGLMHFDWITVSPKVAEHVLAKNFVQDRASDCQVHELRYVRHKGQAIPQPSLTAQHYYLSPHSDGQELNMENVKHCIELCKKHPQWSLNLQTHKLIKVL